MDLSAKQENRLFTAGAIAKGVIYVLIGGFTVATVIGAGQGPQGPKAVLRWVYENPFGQILLFVLGLGLLCYGAWRWYTAIENPFSSGDDASDVVKRIGYAASGTTYTLLAYFAYKLLFQGGGSGQSKEGVIAWLLDQSWGQAVLGIIGLGVAGAGIYQLYKGLTDKHMEGVNQARMSQEEEETYKQAGRIGLVSRFIVYGVMAYFLLRAAFMENASEFKGMSEAISSIATWPFGTVLLVITGVGLLAHGTFMFVRAKYENPATS